VFVKYTWTESSRARVKRGGGLGGGGQPTQIHVRQVVVDFTSRVRAWGAGSQLVSGADLILGLVFFFFCFFPALLLLPIYSQFVVSFSLSLSLITGRNHTCYGSSIWPRLSFIMKFLSLSSRMLRGVMVSFVFIFQNLCVCVCVFFFVLENCFSSAWAHKLLEMLG
jgi:hypothetical protein